MLVRMHVWGCISEANLLVHIELCLHQFGSEQIIKNRLPRRKDHVLHSKVRRIVETEKEYLASTGA
jgi:hypothetical protein